MDKLTGLKDVDREILKYLPDKELLIACRANKRMWNEVCDDNFLRRRLREKYGDIEKYKKENESWKRFFLRAIYYISKLKDIFKYEYMEGNFETQYQLLYHNKNMNRLYLEAASNGELPLVKFALKNGAFLHFLQDAAVRNAAGEGHLDVLKYLVNLGANIPPYALIEAVSNNHFDVVKYLVGEKKMRPSDAALTRALLFERREIVKYLIEHGANVHAENDYALRWAARAGHFDLVRLLVEKGANIHAENEYALLWAVENGHFEIVRFLIEHGADISTYNNKALRIAKEFGRTEIYNYLLSL